MITSSSLVNELLSTYADSAMCRIGQTNFVAIPTGDPNQPYLRVAVTNAKAKADNAHEAFDFDKATADYQTWLKAHNERVNAPKKEKSVNTEAQARREALDTILEQYVATKTGEFTANEALCENIKALPDNTLVMAVGSSLIRLTEKGILTCRMDGRKRYYTKA